MTEDLTCEVDPHIHGNQTTRVYDWDINEAG